MTSAERALEDAKAFHNNQESHYIIEDVTSAASWDTLSHFELLMIKC